MFLKTNCRVEITQGIIKNAFWIRCKELERSYKLQLKIWENWIFIERWNFLQTILWEFNYDHILKSIRENYIIIV